MSILQRFWRAAFITLLFAAVTAPAHAAEPLTMFLLKMLRDQMATAALESAFNSLPSPVEKPATPPALVGVYGISEEQLRGLIDAGFVHLTAAQRNAVYASLRRMLTDPRNALARPLIIEELAQQASAVRGAHERLAALSAAEKRAIHLINMDFSDPEMRKGMGKFVPGLDLDDPEVQREMREFRLPVGMFDELRKVGLGAGGAAPRVHAPTLVIQGRGDELVRVDVTRQLLARLPGPLTYHEVAGAHDLPDQTRPAWPSIQYAVLQFARQIEEAS